MRLVSSVCLIAAVGPFLRAADCLLMTAEMDVISNVLRAVSASDKNWFNVLKLNVKVDRKALSVHVVDMLDELEMSGPVVRVHKVVSYLVTHPGSAGTQKMFGMQVLGTAVLCQTMGTLLVHTKILSLYARRAQVNVNDIRSRMSQIQMALPGYVDKVSFFGQSIDALVKFNKTINAVFAEHDAAAGTASEMSKKSYIRCLTTLCKNTLELMDNRCGTSDEKVIGDTLKINSYDKNVFGERKGFITHHQMMTMIDYLDSYDFINVKMMDAKLWMKQLHIVPFVQENSELVYVIDEEDDD